MSTTEKKRPSKADLEGLADWIEGDEFTLSGWTPRPGRPRLDPASTEHAPRLAIRIPASLRRRVERKAHQEGRTLSQVVRALLEGYADRR